MRKISVIGAGNVGATTAQRLVEKELAEVIVLVDIVEGLAEGKALDIYQSSSLEGFKSYIFGTTDFSQIKDSGIVIVTAGLARKPGMTREDLLKKNAEIIRSISEQIRLHATNSIVIVVTNPLDVMTQLVQHTTGFNTNRVIGMAGLLDTGRLATFIAQEIGCKPTDVKTMIVGSHGDSMVPILSETKLGQQLLKNLRTPEKIKELFDRARNGGAEIVKLLKTGSAFYAPSSCAVFMVDQIIKHKCDLIPCSVYLQGTYDITGVYIGAPCRLGKNGVEKIIDIGLTEEEKAALQKSAQIVKDNFALICK
ncbi:malate dehydrogenase [Candidatus Margulisiibacteriota bacterium]